MKHKYEELAEEIGGLIRAGTYQPGAPVPSVRVLSAEKRISITTVLKAYYLLEAQGLVEARKRSGFYVNPGIRVYCAEPEISTPDPDPTQVDVQALVKQLLKDASNPDLVPLGLAYPDMELYGIARLNRLMSAVARRNGKRARL